MRSDGMTDERAAVVLTNCPFCGGDAIARLSRSRGQDQCVNCGAEGPDRRSTKAWNARPIEDALRAENERLKAENASLKEANEIDLGEKTPLIFENTELSARVSELTRLLAEAEEGIREIDAMRTLVTDAQREGHFEIGEAEFYLWRESAPVQRAVQSGERGNG